MSNPKLDELLGAPVTEIINPPLGRLRCNTNPLDDMPPKPPAQPVAVAYSVQWFAWPKIVTTATHKNLDDAVRDRDARQAEELPIAEGGARWVVIRHELME